MTSSSCPLCRAPSEEMAAVADYFFGSPGTWKYWRCTGTRCGVAFPFPAPDDEQLEAAYSSYYTHDDSGGTTLPGSVEARMTRFVASGSSGWQRLPVLGWLSEQVAWELGGLVPHNGTVMDIGCGDGARLARLRRAGWAKAMGVEPDPAAVRVAQEAGLDVRYGTAESIPIEDETIDAALMHHVIEHVRDPKQSFAEVSRILRPGGELSIVTPNIDSLGRDRWGVHWRGYEAPRHLTIFTIDALRALANSAGFEVVCSRSSARSAAWVDEISARAAGEKREPLGLAARIRRADQAFRKQSASGQQKRGEEIVFIARKR